MQSFVYLRNQAPLGREPGRGMKHFIRLALYIHGSGLIFKASVYMKKEVHPLLDGSGQECAIMSGFTTAALR